MSSNPRSAPRLITPSASPASTIRGKIVTMSNFIQLEQSLGRFDPDSPGGDVDVDADLSGQRHQYFTTRTVDDQPAAAGTALNPNDRSYRLAFRRLDRATNQLMLVVAARLERLQRCLRNSQLESSEALDRFDARQSFEADHRAAVLHARGRNRELFFASRRSRPQRRSRAEPFGDEIRLGIDNDIAAETMGPGHPAHDSHVIPRHHRQSPNSNTQLPPCLSNSRRFGNWELEIGN